ncbi:MAG: hypothetical protein HY650_02265, partial [Acidobacteria bacterium]|nr:hypothetical protein [Acidobacteriota bacterium]
MPDTVMDTAGSLGPSAPPSIDSVLRQASADFVRMYDTTEKVLSGNENALEELETLLAGERGTEGEPAPPERSAQAAAPEERPVERQAASTEEQVSKEVEDIVNEVLGKNKDDQADGKLKIDVYRLNDPTYINELAQQNPQAAVNAMRLSQRARQLVDQLGRTIRAKKAAGSRQIADEVWRAAEARRAAGVEKRQPAGPTATDDPELLIIQKSIERLSAERNQILESLKALDAPPPPAPKVEERPQQERPASTDDMFQMSLEPQAQPSDNSRIQEFLGEMSAAMDRRFARLDAAMRMGNLQNALRDLAEQTKEIKSRKAYQHVLKQNERAQLEKQSKEWFGYIDTEERAMAGDLDKIGQEIDRQ